jgi:hypothetical protein
MYHLPNEIIDVVNLMLLNDNFHTISEKDFFKGHTMIQEKKERFKQIIKGYISFIRKENPLTFPKRIYPDKAIGVSDYIFNKFKFKQTTKEIYKNIDKNSKTLIMKCVMSKKQKDSYMKCIDNEKKCGSILNNILEIGLFDNSDDILTKRKLRLDTFTESSLQDRSCKIYQLIKNIKNNPTKGPIFIYSNFIKAGIIPLSLALLANGIDIEGRTSKKSNLYKIVSGLKTTSGDKIKLPDFHDGSVLHNAICYRCCQEKDKCTKVDHKFIPMKFNIIAGNTEHQEEIRTKYNNVKNKDGADLKIIIGSVVVKEGINLYRVRQIHILEPWHNKSRMDQVVGRGIRFCSHADLPKNERNVKIYQYASVLDSGKYDYKDYNSEIIEEALIKEFEEGQYLGKTISIEMAKKPKKFPGTDKKERRNDLEPILSYDIIMYKRGEILNTKTQEVEKLLKESAIDCNINKALNKPEEHNYKCDGDLNQLDKDIKTQKVKLDITTFDNIFLSPYVDYAITLIKEYIKRNKSEVIFRNKILEIPEFKNEIIFKDPVHGKYIIQKALYELTPKSQDLSTFYHIFKLESQYMDQAEDDFGYMIPRILPNNEIVYIFQKLETNLRIRSKYEDLPMYYRRHIYDQNSPVKFNTFFDNIFKQKDKKNILTVKSKSAKQYKKLKQDTIKKYYNTEIRKKSIAKEADYVGFEIEGIPIFYTREWVGKPPSSRITDKSFNMGRKYKGDKKSFYLKILNKFKEFTNNIPKKFEEGITKTNRIEEMKEMFKKLNELDKDHIWYIFYKN